jgi:hypothetical protein
MVSLTSAEGAEDDVVERRPGSEKESALDGAAGDEDEGARFGEVSEFSGHTYKTEKLAVIAHPLIANKG